MPRVPSSACTYVRTLVSTKRPAHGTKGMPGVRMSRWKGISPTQAAPRNGSTRSPAGRSGCTTSGGYGQCRKLRSVQRWTCTVRDRAGGGSGPMTAGGAGNAGASGSGSLIGPPLLSACQSATEFERMLKSSAQKGRAMARSGVGSRGSGATGERTRRRIVEAATETLKSEGFAGASARAIARTGGFNQALVFYHFGSVNELLIAALDATSETRMARYREAVGHVESLGELFRVATEIYAEDLDVGHIKILAELMAASTTFPELRTEIVARIEPWVQFTEAAISRHLEGSPFAQLLPPRDVAYGVVALYLGLEMLANLDDNRDRADSLFATGERFAALFESFSGTR